jgi:hypothetical protein
VIHYLRHFSPRHFSRWVAHEGHCLVAGEVSDYGFVSACFAVLVMRTSFSKATPSQGKVLGELSVPRQVHYGTEIRS